MDFPGRGEKIQKPEWLRMLLACSKMVRLTSITDIGMVTLDTIYIMVRKLRSCECWLRLSEKNKCFDGVQLPHGCRYLV